MKEVLKLENICKTYQAKNGETEAVRDVNFSVNEGEFVSIIGPSGCGKSTILSIVAGLENKSSGKIYIDAVETARNIGIRKERAANYEYSKKGTRNIYAAVDCAVSAMRCNEDIAEGWKEILSVTEREK